MIDASEEHDGNDTPLVRLFDQIDIDPDDFWTIAGASAWRRFDETYECWIGKGFADEAIWDVLHEEIPPEPRRLQSPESFEQLIKERSYIYASPTRRLFYETDIDPDQFWRTPGASEWRGFADVYQRWVARGFAPDAIWYVLSDNRPANCHLKPPRYFDTLIRAQTLDSEASAAAMNAYENAYDEVYEECDRRLTALEGQRA